MSKEEIKCWRIIVEILEQTGYRTLYQEEVSTVANCLKRLMEKEK